METKHVPSGCPHLHADAINCNVSRICLGPTSISLSIVFSENRETTGDQHTHTLNTYIEQRSLLPLVVAVVYNLKADAINQSTNLHFKCAFNKFSTRLHCCFCCCCPCETFLFAFVVVVRVDAPINHNLKA